MRFLSMLVTTFFLLLITQCCFAAANIELWPVTQSIVANKNDSVLWIKNINDTSVSLQIRVFKWQQVKGKDILSSQTDVYPDPPFLVIGPHKQVAVRFFSNASTIEKKSDKEATYRIVIDQLPTPDISSSAGSNAQNSHKDDINIRMEYILPLFIYGDAMPKKILPGIDGIPNEAHKVQWGIKNINGVPSLYITNQSLTHIRLLSLSIDNGTTNLFKATPKNNYILPNDTLILPLAKHSPLTLQKGDVLTITEPYSHDESFAFS